MIKPKTKVELLKLLNAKTFKILLIDEGKAMDIADQIKKLNAKRITVIVLD
jgi:hypothetical protein